MYVVLHNASDKTVAVTVYGYSATGGDPIGKSPIEVNPRQTKSFGPGAAATIEIRVPPTLVVAAYASGTNELLACDKR